MSAPASGLRSPRARELVSLGLVALLAAAGFSAAIVARSRVLSATSLVYAAAFLLLLLAAHVAVRTRIPRADASLLALVAALSVVGLVEIGRISPDLARDQALWLLLGVSAFAVVLLVLPDYRVLERYRYLLGAGAVLLLVATIVFSYATGTVVNGARLWIRVGGVQFQPAELSKIMMVVFLAGYLRERREQLAVTRGRFLGMGVPPLRHFGPLLAMWGAALLVLVAMNDLGTSLLFFGVFVALVYVATGRGLYAVVGLGAFAVGAFIAYRIAPQVGDRLDIWLDPWADAQGKGYQVIQSLYALADGGLLGNGIGQGYLLTDAGRPVIPAVQTDFIYSAITDELGLAGATGVLLLYVLIAWRGFKIAATAGDGFSKLLAAGITTTIVLQAVIIVGGVVRLVPLTGITLPWISYGGSSTVANWLALALLLAISHRAAEDASA